MLSMASTGFAQTTTPAAGLADAVPAVMEPVQTPSVVQMYGQIVAVEKEGDTLAVEVKPADEGESMIFYVDESTYILDAMNGLPMERRIFSATRSMWRKCSLKEARQAHFTALCREARLPLPIPRHRECFSCCRICTK